MKRLALTLILAALKLAMFSTAHGGQLKSDLSWHPRRLRKTTRITVLRPIRAKGRAQAGYPLLSTTANCTRIVANVTGLLNPIGWFLR